MKRTILVSACSVVLLAGAASADMVPGTASMWIQAPDGGNTINLLVSETGVIQLWMEYTADQDHLLIAADAGLTQKPNPPDEDIEVVGFIDHGPWGIDGTFYRYSRGQLDEAPHDGIPDYTFPGNINYYMFIGNTDPPYTDQTGLPGDAGAILLDEIIIHGLTDTGSEGNRVYFQWGLSAPSWFELSLYDGSIIEYMPTMGTGSSKHNPVYVYVSSPEPASLDIKPGSCPNPLNRWSHGVLPIAVVGMDDFDVTQIDVSSVRLRRADRIGGQVAPHEGPPGPHSVFEDVATLFEGEACDCHDLADDGIVDLSAKFKTDDVVEALLLDDLPAGALVELVVTGSLLDGTAFEGSDCVRLVPPGTAGALLAVESSVAGAWIEADPLDETLDGGGFTDFVRSMPLTTVVTLTAEEWAQGRPLRGWQIGGLLHHMGQTSVQLAIDQDMTVLAVYGPTPSGGSPKPPGELTPDEMVPDEMVPEPIQGQSAESGTIDRR